MSKQKPISLINIYFFIIITAACLIGQQVISDSIAYIIISFFYLFAIIKAKLWQGISDFFDNKFELLFFIFLLYLLIFGVFGVNFFSTTIHVLVLFPLFFLLRKLVLKPSFDRSKELEVLVFISAIVVFLSIIALIFAPQLVTSSLRHGIQKYDYVIGFPYEKNHFGAILHAFIIIAFLYLFSGYLTRKAYVVFSIFIFIMYILLVMTHSRASIFSVIIFFGFLIISALILKNRRAFLIFAVNILFICLAFKYFSSFYSKNGMNNNFEFHSVGGRPEIWHKTLQALQFNHSDFFFGNGFGNQIHFLRNIHLPYQTLHNSLLTVLIGGGVIGLLIFVCALYFYFLFLLKHAIRAKTMYAYCLLVGSVSILLHCMAESFLFSQLLPFYFLFLFLFYLARKNSVKYSS